MTTHEIAQVLSRTKYFKSVSPCVSHSTTWKHEGGNALNVSFFFLLLVENTFPLVVAVSTPNFSPFLTFLPRVPKLCPPFLHEDVGVDVEPYAEHKEKVLGHWGCGR